MLYLRPLTPLTSPCVQWQLRAVLRLPPELRQLALRSLNTSTPSSQAYRKQDDIDFTEEIDAPGSLDTSSHVRSDTRLVSKTEEQHRRRPGQDPSKGQRRHSLAVRTKKGETASSRKIWIAKGREWTGDPKLAVRVQATKMRQGVSRGGSMNAGNRRKSQGDRNELSSRATSEIQASATGAGSLEASSIPSRLTLLKQTLLESPDSVLDVAAIQWQLNELEDVLRNSFKAGQNYGGSSQSLASKKARPTSTTEADNPRAMLETLAKQEDADYQTQIEANAATVNTQDVSVLAELRPQIQELVNLLKLLVSQQSVGESEPPVSLSELSEVIAKMNDLVAVFSPSSTRGTHGINGKGRYQAMRNSQRGQPGSVEFAVFPQDAEFEDGITSAATMDDGSSVLRNPDPLTQARHAPADEGSSLESTGNLNTSPANSTGSLYDQLFPEEAAAAKPQQRPAIHAPVPRLPLFGGADPQLQSVNAKPVWKSQQLAQLYDSQQERPKTVLILRSASKTLTEDDFRRAMPRGKHIQEWTQKGEYERIIPVRNFWTLERTGDYYIVFKHPLAADAFLQHVKRVFNMAKERTPSSLLSPLPPAPKGLLRDGAEDEAELVRNFNLMTPSMPFTLEREGKGVKGKVLEKGGYPQALSSGLTPDTPQVLLEMDGGNMPNWFQLRDAITRDGTQRGLPWILLPGELAIRRLAMKKPARSQAELDAQWESSNIGGGGGDRAGDVDEAVDWDNAAEAEAASLLAQDRLKAGQNGQRWIVAFREKEEAQRFARLWHMRGFPWSEGQMKTDYLYKGVTRVKAEVLW